MLTLDFEELAVVEVKKEGIISGKTKGIPKSNQICLKLSRRDWGYSKFVMFRAKIICRSLAREDIEEINQGEAMSLDFYAII